MLNIKCGVTFPERLARLQMNDKGEFMKIKVSESTAIKKTVKCENGHVCDVWYIGTPEGIVMEFGSLDHVLVPTSREDQVYKDGDCCFRAACEEAWNLRLEI